MASVCAFCEETIVGKPIIKGGQRFCSNECVEAYDSYEGDEDEDEYEDDYDDDYDDDDDENGDGDYEDEDDYYDDDEDEDLI